MKVDPKYEKKRKYRKDAETLRGNSPDDVRQNRHPATIETPLNRSANESKLEKFGRLFYWVLKLLQPLRMDNCRKLNYNPPFLILRPGIMEIMKFKN